MVLRLVLGTVYTLMGLLQLASVGAMSGVIGAYGLVHGAAASALAALLIAGELVCGVWFLARPRGAAITPVWVYTAVSLVWAALAVQAYARGLPVHNCGCFGVHLRQRLGWFVLLQDALTLLYAGLLLHGTHRAAGRPATADRTSDKSHGNSDAKARTR